MRPVLPTVSPPVRGVSPYPGKNPMKLYFVLVSPARAANVGLLPVP